MTNKKSTKRALLLSALSLLMCVSMLIGSTFAWFTDSVTSGINKIEAGNLDIELYHGKVADPEAIDGNKVEGATNIFMDKEGKDIAWEPGVVAWTNLKVANEGSLALKYQLAINFTNENYIKENNAKLSEVLKVAFLENPVTGTTREEVFNAAKGEGVLLKDLMKSGELLTKGANKIYGVVIYWEPGANDNTWNVYNGRTTSDGEPLHIDLGITLVATQKDAEFDSFGNDYDKDAFTYAATAQEIADAVRNAKDGDTVYIKAGSYVLTSAQNLYIENKSIDVVGVGNVNLTWNAATTSHLVYVHNTADEAMTVNLKNLHLDGKKLHATKGAGFWVRSDGGDITVNIESCSSKDFGYDEVQIDNSYSAGAKILVNLTDVTAQAACMNAIATTRSEIKYDPATCNIGTISKQTWGSFVAENQYINGDNGLTRVVGVTTADELTAAVTNAADGDTVVLLNDITGDATAKQIANVDVVIDGNEHTLTGHLFINGRSAATSPETLTIKNLHITSDYYVANGEYALINAYYEPTSGNGATRNIHNVTIEDCTFTVTGAAKHIAPAIDLYQPFNVKIINCEVTGAHSVLQNKGGEVIYVEKVTATDCKNGISFGTNTKATIKNCDIKSVGAGGYGIRTDASDAYSLTVEDCKIEAFVPVLARKMTGANYCAAFAGTNNVLTATNTYGYQVVFTKTDWDNDSAVPEAPTGSYTLTGADSFTKFPNN